MCYYVGSIAVYPVTACSSQGGHDVRLTHGPSFSKSKRLPSSWQVRRWSPVDVVACPVCSAREWSGRLYLSSPSLDKDERSRS
jgi:hypothetical protein